MKLKHCYLGNTQKLIPQDWVKGDAKITLIIANLFPSASFLVTLYKLTIQYLPLVYQIFVFSNVPTQVNLEQLSNIIKTPSASGVLIFFFFILAPPCTWFGLSLVLRNLILLAWILPFLPSPTGSHTLLKNKEGGGNTPLKEQSSASPAYHTWED